MAETRGLVLINTGEGKGKTTAALGVALRAAGNGLKVLIRQFIKGSWTPGEHKAVRAFPGIIDLKTLGKGFLREKDDAALTLARLEMKTVFAQVREELLTTDAAIMILDEILYAVKFGLLTEEAVLELIAGKREKQPALHLILTGRGATPAMIEAADLVTEMVMIKHPYPKGISAQVGLEF